MSHWEFFLLFKSYLNFNKNNGLLFLLSRESEGVFRYGSYQREANDLRDVVQYFYRENRSIAAIIGHSKGISLYVIRIEFRSENRILYLFSFAN